MESNQSEDVAEVPVTSDAVDGGGRLDTRLSARVLAESMSLLEDSDILVDEESSLLAPLESIKSASEEEHQPVKADATRTKKEGKVGTLRRTSAETVSVERKEELLMEARANRLQWIHQVPLPYRKAESPDDPWVQEKGLASFLKTCHAAALMPSTTKVLSHLYGMEDQLVSPEEVADRIESLVSASIDRSSCLIILNHSMHERKTTSNYNSHLLIFVFWCVRFDFYWTFTVRLARGGLTSQHRPPRSTASGR